MLTYNIKITLAKMSCQFQAQTAPVPALHTTNDDTEMNCLHLRINNVYISHTMKSKTLQIHQISNITNTSVSTGSEHNRKCNIQVKLRNFLELTQKTAKVEVHSRSVTSSTNFMEVTTPYNNYLIRSLSVDRRLYIAPPSWAVTITHQQHVH